MPPVFRGVVTGRCPAAAALPPTHRFACGPRSAWRGSAVATCTTGLPHGRRGWLPHALSAGVCDRLGSGLHV
eukprot:8829822-Alexandrium_andersonii.AAC.1